MRGSAWNRRHFDTDYREMPLAQYALLCYACSTFSLTLTQQHTGHRGISGLLITIHLFNVLGKFIQCCISVYLIFSSTSKNHALVDSLNMVGHVLLLVKGISAEATWKCPFPNMFCSIVIAQLLP